MTRNVTAAIALTLALGACSQPAAPPGKDAAPPAAATTTTAAATSQADIDAIIERHGAGVKAPDVEAVVADYADDAILVTPPGMASPTGVYAGKAKVREFFSWLTSPKNLPGPQSMVATSEMIAPDTVLFRWTQFKGTPQEVNGTDVFVIRGGKIVFQSVMPKG
jgi:hypothetical protein